MKKKRKKSKNQRFKKRCDALITEAGKKTICAVCGKKPAFYHHLIPRNHALYRHDFCNLLPLCPTHHKFSNKMAAHSTNALAVREFVKWLRKNYPKKYKFSLDHQFDIGYNVDYEARFEELKKQLCEK